MWTPPQLRDALGVDDGALAARVFGVVDGGDFEHGTTVLSMPYPFAQVARSMSIDEPALRARVEDIRISLRMARTSRPAPERDGKVITAWNALAIRAFAEAGPALERPDYVAIARRCADFVLEHLVRDGVVHRIWNGGEGRIIGFLDDAANLGDALLTLYEATGESRYFTAALGLCERIVEQHRDADGNYFDTAGDSEPLIVRPRTIDDNPVSAGQSVAAALFCRMHAFTGEERWHIRAMEIIAPLATVVARAPLAVAGLAAAMELAVGPMREIAIAGDPADTRRARSSTSHSGDSIRSASSRGGRQTPSRCSPDGLLSTARPRPMSVAALSVRRRSPGRPNWRASSRSATEGSELPAPRGRRHRLEWREEVEHREAPLILDG